MKILNEGYKGTQLRKKIAENAKRLNNKFKKSYISKTINSFSTSLNYRIFHNPKPPNSENSKFKNGKFFPVRAHTVEFSTSCVIAGQMKNIFF